ncbi:hypothetical protein PIROE2DRAFT_9844, partial [Piromyces sp. E2]
AVNAINITAIAYAYSEDSQFYTPLINSFNEYSKEQGLDINVQLTFLSNSNTTRSLGDYISLLNLYFKKKSTLYDIYFYETDYSENYDQYLLDLKNRIPEEHIKLLDQGIINDKCILNGKLIGLPITLSASVLYYNKFYMDKYKKKPPKTWNELLETSKYILNEERKNNNQIELKAFNGLFNGNWAHNSFYEFIYSCRDSIDSPFPEIKSNATVRAYETIKELIKEISTDEEFKSQDDYSLTELLRGSSIFIKYWIMAEPINSIVLSKYEMTALPGYFEGVSSSRMGGFNVAINKNIENNKEKVDAAIQFLKYATSKEVQKYLFLRGDSVPVMNSLYEDKELCNSGSRNCEMLKNLQHMKKPKERNNEIPDYDKMFYLYSKQYLYEGKSIKQTLDNLENISKIYYISLDSNESLTGLIRMWILVIVGIVTTMMSLLTNIGKITDQKCNLKILIFTLGYTLTIVPLLCQFIRNFPEKNKFSRWVKKHKKENKVFKACKLTYIKRINDNFINNIDTSKGTTSAYCNTSYNNTVTSISCYNSENCNNTNFSKSKNSNSINTNIKNNTTINTNSNNSHNNGREDNGNIATSSHHRCNNDTSQSKKSFIKKILDYHFITDTIDSSDCILDPSYLDTNQLSETSNYKN